jgi:hypothetical protein
MPARTAGVCCRSFGGVSAHDVRSVVLELLGIRAWPAVSARVAAAERAGQRDFGQQRTLLQLQSASRCLQHGHARIEHAARCRPGRASSRASADASCARAELVACACCVLLSMPCSARRLHAPRRARRRAPPGCIRRCVRCGRCGRCPAARRGARCRTAAGQRRAEIDGAAGRLQQVLDLDGIEADRSGQVQVRIKRRLGRVDLAERCFQLPARRLQVGPARQQVHAEVGGQRMRRRHQRDRFEVGQRAVVGAGQRAQRFTFVGDVGAQHGLLLADQAQFRLGGALFVGVGQAARDALGLVLHQRGLRRRQLFGIGGAPTRPAGGSSFARWRPPAPARPRHIRPAGIQLADGGGDLRAVLAPPVEVVAHVQAQRLGCEISAADRRREQAGAGIALAVGVGVGRDVDALLVGRLRDSAERALPMCAAATSRLGPLGQRLLDQGVQLFVVVGGPPLRFGPAFVRQLDAGRQFGGGDVAPGFGMHVAGDLGAAGQGQRQQQRRRLFSLWVPIVSSSFHGGVVDYRRRVLGRRFTSSSRGITHSVKIIISQ